MSIIREIEWPVGGKYPNFVFETRRVGIREDALTDAPCSHCHGSGRRVHGSRSRNCETGNHTARCIGNIDPAKCICFCHEAKP